MKVEVLECLYIKPLQLLKIWGRTDRPLSQARISIKRGLFKQKESLGDATLDVYVRQPQKECWKEQYNFVFQKVMPLEQKGGLSVFAELEQDGNTEGHKLKITFQDVPPEQFCSSIGTKTGILFQEKEQIDRFCEGIRESGYCPPLTFLHVESSSICNLKCRYCVVSNNYECIERSVISDEVLTQAIETIKETPTLKTVQISGLGEPLTNPGFCDMLERIEKETHIRNVWFFTNAMLLTPEISERLAQSKLNLRIVVSIDGNTPEENDFYRNGSKYEVVRRNLLTLLKETRKRPYFRIQIHNLVIRPKTEGDSGTLLPPPFLLEDFGFLKIDTHRAFYFPELKDETLKADGMKVYREPHKQFCKRMFLQATIRSNGDVVRCHWDSTCSHVMGNILEKPFTAIWHGDKYIELRKTMMPEAPFDALPLACQKCHAMNDGYLYSEDQ